MNYLFILKFLKKHGSTIGISLFISIFLTLGYCGLKRAERKTKARLHKVEQQKSLILESLSNKRRESVGLKAEKDLESNFNCDASVEELSNWSDAKVKLHLIYCSRFIFSD